MSILPLSASCSNNLQIKISHGMSSESELSRFGKGPNQVQAEVAILPNSASNLKSPAGSYIWIISLPMSRKISICQSVRQWPLLGDSRSWPSALSSAHSQRTFPPKCRKYRGTEALHDHCMPQHEDRVGRKLAEVVALDEMQRVRRAWTDTL